MPRLPPGFALVIPLTVTVCLAADKTQPVAPLPVPDWVFPGEGKPSSDDPPDWPGDNPFLVTDWHPETHGPMPAIVSRGREPDVFACGYCHLPDGGGRPENASVAGLPAAYIARELGDFISGARRAATQRGPFAPSAAAEPPPAHYMIQSVRHATPAELAAATAYFSALRTPDKVRIVETSFIPHPRPRDFLYFLDRSGPLEPLGRRIIEVPVDPAAHARHDAVARYVAYVPRGSLARGAALAAAGPAGPATACFICHGPGLRGGSTAPPLAGRSPSGLIRQLLAFRNRTRAGPDAGLMQPVVANLTIDDMIALSAYATASRP